MNTDIDLFVQDPDRPPASLGVILVRGLQVDNHPHPRAGIRLSLGFTHDPGSAGARWVAIDAAVWSAQGPPRPYGLIEIDPWSAPTSGLPDPRMPRKSLVWRWRLWPEDIEQIERDQEESTTARQFELRVGGLVHLGDGESIRPVSGSGSFDCAISQWEGLLNQLGYGVAPSIGGQLSPAATAKGYWGEAERRLAPAREQLRAGETYKALTTCLGEFEKLATNPYQEANWRQAAGVSGLPEQKAEAVARLLSGHCTYLNKVGHHRDRQQRNVEGDLVSMPIEHWEADLIVTSSHVLLTYALRLRGTA